MALPWPGKPLGGQAFVPLLAHRVPNDWAGNKLSKLVMHFFLDIFVIFSYSSKQRKWGPSEKLALV